MEADEGRTVAEPGKWQSMIATNPQHSVWYADRFRQMEAAGQDLAGEARFVDALAPRNARILDAGCGPGRLCPSLVAAGHEVVGVDVDPYLIEVARTERPGATYLVADLAELDLPAAGITEGFDVIVCAGNVMGFLAPSTRVETLRRMRAHLRAEGRIAIGFGAGRGYGFDEFFADAAEAGLRVELNLSAWDIRPFTLGSNFLVSVLQAR